MQGQETIRPQAQNGQYLSFRVGIDDYAVDILRVQEIRGWEKVRGLPDSRDEFTGVLDFRGTMVPIVDLRVRFGCPDAECTATTVVIVVSVDINVAHKQLVGMVVDSVLDVLDIDPEAIRPAPQLGAKPDRHYVNGMLKVANGMVVVLDLDALFGSVDFEQ